LTNNQFNMIHPVVLYQYIIIHPLSAARLSVTNTSYTQSEDMNTSQGIYGGIGAAVVGRC